MQCTACRGTGQVISNLGGVARTVSCPWCEGGGVFLPGHDAQAARRGEADTATAAPDADQAGESEEAAGDSKEAADDSSPAVSDSE
jgi:DnaJ-class molecular chaperone